MTTEDEWPEFGIKHPRQSYIPRPGSYAVISDGQGRVAVMQTPQGGYLPGGGSEGAETPEETLTREVCEECGFDVSIVRHLGQAVEYVHTVGHGEGIRKECIFFQATIHGLCDLSGEADHTLLWLEPQEAQARLAHGSQRWAVGRIER